MTDRPGRDELLFLPLGGCGEIGMNLNLYGHDGKWLMVDLGITFGNESTPGIDVIMPDPAFIVKNRADLLGLVLTHAHEDHIGAVPYLWPRLRCPIYATPFTTIATGGLAPLFVGATPVIAHLEPEITMKGLVEIHRLSRKNRP